MPHDSQMSGGLREGRVAGVYGAIVRPMLFTPGEAISATYINLDGNQKHREKASQTHILLMYYIMWLCKLDLMYYVAVQ